MFAISRGSKTINDERVDTFIRSIAGEDTLLEVEAGTNGFHGGGRKSGSRAYFRLTALNKADFFARVRYNDAGQPVSLEICFCGDEGLTALMKALSFAGDVIKEQTFDQNT